MPQQSILPEFPAMTSLSIRVDSFPLTATADTVRVTVQVGVGGGDPASTIVPVLLGTEADYLATIISEATSAFMYGETVSDVRRAVKDAWGQARVHGVQTQF